MTKKFNLAIIILLMAVGIPFYWLFIENGSGDAAAKPVTIAQLRTLASSQEGPLPRRIRYEHVATNYKMRNLVIAGDGLRSERLDIFAHMLEYKDSSPILIGAGMSKSDVRDMLYHHHVGLAQARVVAALSTADQVIPLNNTKGQLGGLEMITDIKIADRIKKGIKEHWRTDDLGKPYAIAPGVVILPTPSLRPHSRLVFVSLASGREYLLAGLLAPVRQSWVQLRAPARIVTDQLRSDDREEIYSWLMNLQSMKREAPDLTIVSDHKIPRHGDLKQFFPEEANP